MWVATTKAMWLASQELAKNSSSASTPPAEAPTPTTVNKVSLVPLESADIFIRP
jgi:hypothetical protein